MAGRKMNGRAQVPCSQKSEWERLTKEVFDYVKAIKENKKIKNERTYSVY
jgi:hypothetical protein